MQGWGMAGRVAAGMMVTALALGGCSPRMTPLSDRFKEDLADWSAGKAIDDGLRRQLAGEQAPAAPSVLMPGEPIWIQNGKSRIVHFASPVRRVSISNPDLAGIVVLGPTALLVNAKLPDEERGMQASGFSARRSTVGVVSPTTITPPPRVMETSLVVWGNSGAPSSHTVFVADFIDRQVMLEVTVAEVNRTSLEQHGIDFRSVGSSFSSNMFMGGGSGPLFIQPGGVPIGDAIFPLNAGLDDQRPNFAFRLPKDDITALIQVLQSEGLATILAQPKILALSGQNALFQAGGEIPIRIVNAFVAEVEFKPFGTLVNFLPRVSEEGDIMLTVTPEVSQPDFTQTVEGAPTFRTRRVSTTARLRDGETLVLGGLLQTQRNETVRGIPYLQDIPIVGHVFRDTDYSEDVTELMVVVTPRLVAPIPAGEQIRFPTDRPPLTNEEIRTKPDPAEATRPRLPGLGTGATVPGLP
jgi:pilus assembly protein CpaC